ncbi:hypothetical protein D7X94_09690 [Acutalibacter sp. 1XD8-33]|nr:hypothetical protein D7X94_09690 [Acutalibacter sp. 1XD8-33]
MKELVSAFLRKGLCTVRAIAERWKELGAGTDMAPPSAAKGKKAARLLETSGPVVTILEGQLGNYQQGQKLSLLEANELVCQQAQQYQLSGKEPPALRVRLDYMAEGRMDSYILPIKLDEKGDLLDHMQAWVDRYRTDPKLVTQLFDHAPAQHQERLRELLTPLLRDSLNNLSTKVVQHFRRHCEISALEQHLQGQAQAMPKRAQQAFYKTTRESIAALRQAANTEPLLFSGKSPQENSSMEQQQAASGRELRAQPSRQSVRVQLRQNQAKQAARAVPHKAHTVPQR